jgi:acetylornithine deacetylase/succinyl-diaminopimelate desuccinylase-like protein
LEIGPLGKPSYLSLLSDLEKGNIRIEIQFLGKAGLKSPPREEMIKRLDEVVAMFKTMSNEWKGREVGNINATLFLQSTDKSKLALPTKEVLEELAKQRLQRQRKEDKRRT